MKHFIILIFSILVFYFVFNKYLKKYISRENFITKVKLKKKLIVVMMDGSIGENYKGTIKTMCSNLIDNCTYKFDKDSVNNSKKVNITYNLLVWVINIRVMKNILVYHL